MNRRTVVIALGLASLPILWLVLWVANVGLLIDSGYRMIAIIPGTLPTIQCTYFIGIETISVTHYGNRCPVFKYIT
jgi:hypothetical protein